MLVDDAAVLRTYLLAQPSLTALVGTRIYAEHQEPPAHYDPADGPCITFARRGGQPDYSRALWRSSWQFRYYPGIQVGTETDEYYANVGMRTLVSVLDDKRGNGLLSAELEQWGGVVRPETGRLFALAFFETQVLSQLTPA